MDILFSGQLFAAALITGALYALTALGLNLVYGTMRLLNVAHGDLVMIGALLVGLMANYTGFLVPKVALFSNIALMVAILLWRPQGVYPVTNR